MPVIEHKLIDPPEDDAILWKYLDLAKFLSLLTTSTLYFTRLDQFEDPYEGQFSNPVTYQIEGRYSTEKGKQYLRAYLDFHKTSNKNKIFASCWHMNAEESAAMWKLYSMNEYGLAIKTTVKSLRKSIDGAIERIYIGIVKYVDYEKMSIPIGNVFFPPFHKRLSFSYENEVRAVIWSGNSGKGPLPDKLYTTSPVNLETLIHTLYISPTAPGWILPMVKDICEKYNLEIEIVQSPLYILTY